MTCSKPANLSDSENYDSGNCGGLAIRIPPLTSLDSLVSAPCITNPCGFKLSEVQVQFLAEYLIQLITELEGKMYPYILCKHNTSLEFPELGVVSVHEDAQHQVNISMPLPGDFPRSGKTST